METILVVDDEQAFRQQLQTILEGDGYAVECAVSAREAAAACDRRKFDLVLSSLRLPEALTLQRRVADQSPETPFIVMAAPGSLAAAGEAIRNGAAGFAGKPLASVEELLLLVRRALDNSRLALEREFLRDQESARFNCQDIVTRDPAMLATLELAREAASSSDAVLITGEHGTGRQLLARCLHAGSPRARYAFVAVNCAGVAPALLESELFGHEKGALGGAPSRRLGRCERAHLGTLFLAEAGALDASLQTRLLRMLREGFFERTGSARQIPADVRVIAADAGGLKRQVAEGTFREDLYHLLTKVALNLPPLRERRGDIPALARLFICHAGRRLGKPETALTPAAENALTLYDWPGNVRELENVMERVAMTCTGRVEAADLPIGQAVREKPLLWKDIERQAIEEALRTNGGNRTRAARQLGISLRTLQYRLKEWSTAARA